MIFKTKGVNILNNLQTARAHSHCTKFPADLVTLTEEILNGELHFLCSELFPIFQEYVWAMLS